MNRLFKCDQVARKNIDRFIAISRLRLVCIFFTSFKSCGIFIMVRYRTLFIHFLLTVLNISIPHRNIGIDSESLEILVIPDMK